MIFKEITDNSKVVYIVRFLRDWQSRKKKNIIDICHNSYIFRSIAAFWKSIRLVFKYSFLGRVTQIKGNSGNLLTKKNFFIIKMEKLYIECREKLDSYSNISKFRDFIKATKNDFSNFTLKKISIILTFAVLVNSVLSFLYRCEFTLAGCFVRILILIIILIGFSFDIPCQNLIKTSFLFNDRNAEK